MNTEVLQEILRENKQFTSSRKVSLYSNFARLRDSNEDGYVANVNAWKGVLLEAVARGAFEDSTAIEANNKLIGAFSDPVNGTPLALDSVIGDLVRDGTLIPGSKFKSSKRALLRPDFRASTLVAVAMSWLAGRIVNRNWNAGAVGQLRQEKYISVATLKQQAGSLMQLLKQSSRTAGETLSSKVFSEPLVKQITERAGLRLSQLDIDYLLIYLSRETSQIAWDPKKGVLKLGATVIEENDAAIVTLQEQLSALESRTVGLERRIDDNMQTARTALAAGKKATARTALQSRATVEKSLSRNQDLTAQLRVILDQIDEAGTQEQTVAALEQGQLLLSSLNHKTGGVEKVEKLMESLRSEADDVEAVAQELSNISLTNIDEAAIERELAALEDSEALKPTQGSKAEPVAAALANLRAPQHDPEATGEEIRPLRSENMIEHMGTA